MKRTRSHAVADTLFGAPSARRRALLAIPVRTFVLALLWAVIFARLSVEREATTHESMASAAILSSALQQHTIKAIHQVDQITRFVKYEYEKSPDNFDLTATVEKGVVQSDTLVQVSLIDQYGTLIATTANPHPKPIDLSNREHFKVHAHSNDDLLLSAVRCADACPASGPCRSRAGSIIRTARSRASWSYRKIRPISPTTSTTSRRSATRA